MAHPRRYRLVDSVAHGSLDEQGTMALSMRRIDPTREYDLYSLIPKGGRERIGSCKVEGDEVAGYFAVPSTRPIGLNLDPSQVRFEAVWRSEKGVAELAEIYLVVVGH